MLSTALASAVGTTGFSPVGVASVLTTVACYAYPNSVFSELGYDFSSQLVGFCLIDFLAAVALFVVASFAMRWWSSNCRHTPIPE